ncbi:FecR family protein [Maribacter polysaccharolyticus]|uniref:FecR family protein n=1 Tax=Maribacter polysaccharolyticus TaxID=3020831 RepID=UPI00237F55BE|nr:FecR domain-containing protein [Maribacter polysaccharolyticus]MDE3741651.1 FecR domain-containing protein [Maribacter polysaccharolyticus]
MDNNKSDSKVKYLPITDSEKDDLEKRIFVSLAKSSKRRRGFRFISGIAASIVFISGLGMYYHYNVTKSDEGSIIDYVNTTNKENDPGHTEEVTLILGKGKELKINGETSEIQYSSSGEKIVLGATKTVNQETVDKNEVVYNTLMVPFGRRLKTELSDGSVVWLNSGSKLVYPVVFKSDKREVYLEGEAIFEVAHNKKKPFHVISENQVVEVLGTVFAVTNYKDENSINTVLKSGSVQISYLSGTSASEVADKIKITPGTKASFDKETKGIVSEKVDVDTYFSWREGLLIFKNNNLPYIMKRISRYYNMEVAIGDEAQKEETFSGYLDLKDDIGKVMETIKESTDLEYEVNETTITIK